MGTDKEAALKPLEEAAEVYAAWQEYDKWLGIGISEKYRSEERTMFADEIADCIQACCNLATRYGIDLQAAMDRCFERNHERGRV
jgi:NTP pyrophosphatase (non-canonical NTP hydrolase)